MYSLEYLPIARQDMIEIVTYISRDLNEPSVATKIAQRLFEAGEQIPKFPYANPLYIPPKALGHEYRKVLVGNYLMFYWVDEAQKIVTVARVIYSHRDYDKLLE